MEDSNKKTKYRHSSSRKIEKDGSRRKDRKSKDERPRRRSPSADADDSLSSSNSSRRESRRRHRDKVSTSSSRRSKERDGGKDHRHRKKDRKRKSDRVDSNERKKSKRKSSRRVDEGSERKKRATKPDRSLLYDMGKPVGVAPTTLINSDTDYFAYHEEFWVFLFREKGVRFNDLRSEEARKLFHSFAKQYNSGKLEAPYYDSPPTFPSQVLQECKTTQHKWGFQTSVIERKGLEQLQEGVRKLTQYKDDDKSGSKSASKPTADGSINGPKSEGTFKNTPKKTLEERQQERIANRRLREHVKTAQEEITGGAKDFRERKIEKKQEHAARIHGAARDKDEGAAGYELSDAAVFGDGDRSFQDAVARQRQFKARREEQRNSRVKELQNKEKERQANMLKMLGLDGVKPGEKIKIAPRND